VTHCVIRLLLSSLHWYNTHCAYKRRDGQTELNTEMFYPHADSYPSSYWPDLRYNNHQTATYATVKTSNQCIRVSNEEI